MSERVPPTCSACTDMLETDGTYNMLVSGSQDAPCHSEDPWLPGSWSVPRFPFGSATVGGVNRGPSRYGFVSSRASAFNAGVKSVRSLSCTPCRSYGAGLDGI